MKILSLTMNAFSAYHQKTIVDFQTMIDHGLYLISGPTGSGKTTIFDAITFALYGSASGSERNQTYFRSDYADAKEETYVELTFELHQKIYTIKRSPSYLRTGYKTMKMANAYLTYDNYTIEGVKEVNQKIKELLGVDEKQFKQIVMIAQGEFTKLIYASSEERERVLRHIFHSEPLLAFENMLKEETRKLKENYTMSSHLLSSQFQLITLNQEFKDQHLDFHPSYIEEARKENEKINQEYQALYKEFTDIKEKTETLSQEYYQKEKYNQDIFKYQKLDKQYQSLNQQKQSMEVLKQDIDKLKILEKNQTLIYQYQTLQKEYKKNKQDLKDCLEQYQHLSKQYQDIEKNYQEVPSLTQKKEQYQIELSHCQEQKQQLIQYQEALKNYQNIFKQLEALEQEYNQYIQTHEQLEKRIERDQENVDQLPNLQLKLQEMDRDVKAINERRIAIHDLSEIYDSFKNIQDKHYELSRLYQQKHQEYQDLLQYYQHEDELFKRQQAGILALTLKDNEPCPVCGSLEHPSPATLKNQILSSKELEELSTQVEEKKEAMEDIYQEVLLQNNQVQSTKSQIQVYKKQLQIEEELSKEVFIKILSDIMQITQEQKKLYQKQYTEVQYLTKIKNSLRQDQTIFEKQTQQINSLINQKHELDKKLTLYDSQCQHFLSSHEIVSLEILDNYYQEKKQAFNSIVKEIKQRETSYQEVKHQLSLKHQQKEILEKQNQDLSLRYITVEKEFYDFLNQYFKDDFNKYQSQLNDLSNKEKTYQNYMIQYETLTSRLNDLKDFKDAKVIDLTSLKDKIKNHEIHRDEIQKDMNHIQLTYQQNDKLLKDIQKKYQQNQDVLDQYTIYQDLYDQTSGKNTYRMSFERYVLSAYFEHILEYANIELLKMSNGRFALYRKQETKGAKQQGLDLSVLDYETGMMRDVQSLSGGESFKAALSLALGLSQMIQNYAGGIELNTLFIDEGFGSLDNESLDQALSVLLDLKNDNKVIGIISHVNELKERISTQIVVEKGIQGSYLHIEKD